LTNKRDELLKLAEQIIKLSPKMRFVGIIDLHGNIAEGIMKKGKTLLESQKGLEHFCKQVGQRRKMRKEFDKSLGKVRFVHVERENVSQLAVYTKKNTIFVTVEPELSIKKKIQIVNTIKKLAMNI